MRTRFGRTRRARTGASATTAGAKTPTGSTPSIRHNGRNIRPAAGVALNSACNSGSASNAANCEPYPAASYPNARTSQPRPDGNRTLTTRALTTRAARTCRTAGTSACPTFTRPNRRPDRPSQPHNGIISAKNFGSFKNRRATTEANPATIHPSRCTNSGATSRKRATGETADMQLFLQTQIPRCNQIRPGRPPTIPWRLGRSTPTTSKAQRGHSLTGPTPKPQTPLTNRPTILPGSLINAATATPPDAVLARSYSTPVAALWATSELPVKLPSFAVDSTAPLTSRLPPPRSNVRVLPLVTASVWAIVPLAVARCPVRSSVVLTSSCRQAWRFPTWSARCRGRRRSSRY